MHLLLPDRQNWNCLVSDGGTVPGDDFNILTEESLEVKLPTIWTDGKAEVGRVCKSQRREEKKREDQRRE